MFAAIDDCVVVELNRVEIGQLVFFWLMYEREEEIESSLEGPKSSQSHQTFLTSFHMTCNEHSAKLSEVMTLHGWLM